MSQPDGPPCSDLAFEMIESADDAFLRLDGEFRCTYANPAAGRLLGLSKSEMAGESLWDVFPAAAGGSHENYRSAMTNGASTVWEQIDGGRQKWHEIRATPSAQGGLIVRIRDITDRKAGEARLRMSTALAHLGIMEWDPRSECAVWESQGMYEIFGRSQEDCPLTKDQFRNEVLHPGDVTSLDDILAGGMQPGRTFSAVWRIRRRNDGEWRWVEFSGRFEPADGAVPPKLLVVAADITERRCAEERLRNQAEELQAVMDIAPVALWISRDPHCRSILGNRAANELYRVKPKANVSKTPEPGETALPIGFFSDGRELAPEVLPMQRAAATGREVRNEEVEIVHPDGMRQVLWGNALPLWDRQGAVRGALAAFLDISERKRTEQTLAESQADLRHAQELAQTGSWRMDVQRNELLWSDETYRIFGIPKGTSLTYEMFLATVHPEDREFVDLSWQGAIRGEPYDVEHRILVGDSVKWVRERAELEFDSQGTLLGGFGAVQDITERRQTDEALRRFELLAANSRDIILFMQRDGRILEANSAAERAYGYSREELLSLSIHDLRAAGTHAQIAAQLDEADRAAILFETMHRRKDGSTFPVEASSQGATIGGVRTLISVIRDITERRRAGEALRESEALLRAVCESTPDWVYLKDREGRIALANPAMLRSIGRSAQELFGKTEVDFYSDPAMAAAILDTDHLVMASGETQVLEERVETPLGSRVFLSTKAPWKDAQGQVIGLVGVARDITVRKQAEQALAEAKRRQEMMAGVVGRLLASEEPQKIIDDLARRVMERLGCDVYFNFLSDPKGRLHLNACAGVSGEAAHSVEWTGSDPPAELIEACGMTAYACHPLLAGDKVIGTLCFGSRTKTQFSESDLSLMRAVTGQIAIAMERVRVQKALRESEALYRAVARSIPGGAVWVVDPELRFMVVEGSLLARIGMAGDQMEGRAIHEGPGGPACSLLLEERFRRALSGETADYETEYQGLVLWMQFVPLPGENGRVAAAMALALDITERKRVEEQMRHAQKLESIGVLAGGVAHDFNNLLTSILGNASLARLDAPASMAEQLEGIVEASEKAAALTHQLLAYAGKGHIRIDDIDIGGIIHSSAELIRVSVPKNVEMMLDVPHDLPAIRGDSAQMQQVVMNLVINAAEAIGEACDGTVSIRAGVKEFAPGTPEAHADGLTPGRYVYVEVRDTGCGMNDNTKARMFEPFFSTKFTGRGLGLAAVQGILRSHKGGIEVHSSPGRGSTISVYLPCVQSRLTGCRGEEVPVRTQPAATVLVVDDEPAVRSFAKSALERIGHRVLLANNGQLALELLSANSGVDLVLLDVIMPVIGGGEAAAEIRKCWPKIAVLVTSGYNHEEARRLGSLPSGIPFIGKPYTAQTLARAVEQALASRSTAPSR